MKWLGVIPSPVRLAGKGIDHPNKNRASPPQLGGGVGSGKVKK